MYELEKFMSNLADTKAIILNGVNYEIYNCIGAVDDDIVRMSMYIIKDGKLLKISVESVNTK